jgi:3-oxoacyl-[acyl-carrier protein] reductase
VAVNYARGAEAAEQVVESVRAAGGEAAPFQADLSRPDAAAELVRQVQGQWGRLDILVNNAGYCEPAPLERVDPEVFRRHFDLNVLAPVLLAREAAALMERGGRIINLSSGLGSIPAPGNSVYGASKAALESFTRSHAVELGPRGITVNCVAPGTTDTDMLRVGVPADVLPGLIAATPLGRLGLPEDVADVIAFLASDGARWVTGQVIAASGGLR